MRVLLLGANGYLGRFVADRLLADPAVQLTALGRGDDADVRFDLATGSPGALTRFLDAVHPGVVINCAGATRGGARELTRHNTVAVATVCESLRRSGCGARLVQLGCAAEYGPSPARLLHGRGRRAAPRRPVRRQQARRHRTGPRLRPGRRRAAGLLARRPRHPGRLAARPARRGACAAPCSPATASSSSAASACSATSSTYATWPAPCTPPRSPPRRASSTSAPAAPCGCATPPPCSPGSPDTAAPCTSSTRPPGPAGAAIGAPAAPSTGRHAAAPPYPYPDGCGSWQQADVRTARDRLGWRPRINLEESLADIWMEAACRI